MSARSTTSKLPPLESGESPKPFGHATRTETLSAKRTLRKRLTRQEFERRYPAMPQIKKAELIEGVAYVASPVRTSHGVRTGCRGSHSLCGVSGIMVSSPSFTRGKFGCCFGGSTAGLANCRTSSICGEIKG
jgi:hypothetical protein